MKVLEKERVRWYCDRCEVEVRKINEQVTLKQKVEGIGGEEKKLVKQAKEMGGK